ncbi:lysophospholipid acyltransferase family protein [Ignavibacteriales bacterium]
MTILRIIAISIYVTVCSIYGIITLPFDKKHNIYFKLARIFPLGILKLSGIKLVVTGTENIDKERAFVYVPNHSGVYDIPAMQYSVPNRMVMIFKKELGRIPFFGWQLVMGPYISVDRKNPRSGMQSIEEADRLLNERKYSVLLFAEGTRSKDGEVHEFKRGAFYLAVKVKHPIVPVTIVGARERVNAGGKFKIVPGPIYIHYDKPIYPPEGNIGKKEELELMEVVRNKIIENKIRIENERLGR